MRALRGPASSQGISEGFVTPNPTYIYKSGAQGMGYYRDLGSGASAPVPQVMHHGGQIHYVPPPLDPAMLDFPGKISAQELDGCWGATCCLCIPGAARVTSVNEDVYQQCACFALLPCPHETLTRVPGTNKFISSNIDENGSSAAFDETVHSPSFKDWSFGRKFR